MKTRPSIRANSAAVLLAMAAALAGIDEARAQVPKPVPAKPAYPKSAVPKPVPQQAAGPAVPAADLKAWEDLADEAEAMLARADYAGAQQAGEKLLEQALRLFGASHGNTAASHSVLGSALFKQGRYPEAE